MPVVYDQKMKTSRTVQRTKLCRSELLANDTMRKFNAPRLILLACLFYAIVTLCDYLTAADFRALYCKGLCIQITVVLYDNAERSSCKRTPGRCGLIVRFILMSSSSRVHEGRFGRQGEE
ncbi:hypothetical protein EVAR_62215_1 [Eumeta japonica]|uniref:Uncharacterized protein n=1 Tax=Eumeta variegata TaxID=151549 RepID=A0A4C1ZG23_EUMVA|nr:hypothetical protein EVAR_62215_1 [Eumeta japonica]